MAITYPLTLPTSPDFSQANFVARSFVAISQSEFTGNQQKQEHQGNLWGASFAFRPMKRAQFEPWIAALISLNGILGTFLVGDPLGRTPRGSVPGAPAVNGASQTGKELITDGWTATQTGVLLAGDYIQLGTGAQTRLYKVVTDVDSDGGGNATIDIWPRLRESPTNSESLIVNNAKGTFSLASNSSIWDMQVGEFYNLGFDALEAI